MSKKLRVPIPNDIAAEILFSSDRTCCVCNIRGKQVQIHHIDENPANNGLENLSVLCFECHDLTMVKGGFGRKLEANQVRLFRNEWIKRVENRKNKADEIASLETVVGEKIKENEILELEDSFLEYKRYDNETVLKNYLNNILLIHGAQLILAQSKWDSGRTDIMNQGNNDLIDFYEEVLIELSTFYPKGHFINQSPKIYFSEVIASRFRWYRLISEPEGVGTGGTIISTIIGNNVIKDLKDMIIQVVDSLMWHNEIDHQSELSKWRKEFK